MLTEEQLELRKSGIGGSEIGALAGVSPFSTPLDIWRGKKDPSYAVATNHHMERGTFLEDGLAKWYAHRMGAKRLRETGTIRHPKNTIVMCTPDRLAMLESGEVNLSIKAPNSNHNDQWGEEQTDQVPAYCLLQIQWELLVLEELYGVTRAHLAAPIDGDLRIYHFAADHELQGSLVEIASKFWRDHILTNTPPAVDGSDSAAAYLHSRFPRQTQPLKQATSEADAWAMKLKQAREILERAELMEKEAKNKLKEIIGDADGIQGNGWKALWRATKGGTSTDWEALAKELNAPPELIQKHTRLTAGQRRFTPTWKAAK